VNTHRACSLSVRKLFVSNLDVPSDVDGHWSCVDYQDCTYLLSGQGTLSLLDSLLDSPVLARVPISVNANNEAVEVKFAQNARRFAHLYST
jgi:hypothetical protein